MRGAPRAASAWPSEGLRSRRPDASVLGRIVRSEDFERLLAQPVHARSAHFAVYFATGSPSRAIRRSRPPQKACGAGRDKISTDAEPTCQQAVDEASGVDPARGRQPGVWLGTVVPKRHARRAVTRNLIKRQIRACAERMDAGMHPLAPGLWVVRLRAPFDRSEFASPASAALRQGARRELDALLQQCRTRHSLPAATAPR